MRKSIGSDRFKALVEAYGADSKSWPAHERVAALDYIRKQPKKAALWLNAAKAVDGALHGFRPKMATDDQHWETMAKLMPNLPLAYEAVPQTPRVPLTTRTVLMLSLLIMAVIAAGIAVGYQIGLIGTTDERAQAVLSTARIIDMGQ
jgi:hypothetical protein